MRQQFDHPLLEEAIGRVGTRINNRSAGSDGFLLHACRDVHIARDAVNFHQLCVLVWSNCIDDRNCALDVVA